MPKRLAEIEADLDAERRGAEQWAARNGGGNTPGKRLDTGESANAGSVGHSGNSDEAQGRDADGLRRPHREPVSYDRFGTVAQYEDWLLDNGIGYNPLVSKAMPGIGMADRRDLVKHTQVHHCLSFLTEARVALLFRRHVERMTLDAIAAEEGVSRQAIIKRLRVAEQHLADAIREHWDDDVTWEV